MDSEHGHGGAFVNSRVWWLAFAAYWGIILFGYDTGVAGSVVTQAYFEEQFGIIKDGKVDAARDTDISSNVVSVLQAGAFFGALGSAYFSARFGRKWSLIGFTTIFAVGAILTTVANGNSHGLSLIYAGRVVSGIGVGAISAVAPAYVAECAPAAVRGRITGLFQIMVAIGVMLSYFINLGISIHTPTSPLVWRVPFGFQLVPAGLMVMMLLTVAESPRWLASKGRTHEAMVNLAYLRKRDVDDEEIRREFAEIEAAIEEEREARAGLGLREAFLGKGQFVRFAIAFFIFLFQQWSGQNSVGYYAPQIFKSIGYTGTTESLLASGIYGIVKVIATSLFVFFLVETLGRKASLIISALGMGALFFVVGAILKTHPPPPVVVGQSLPPSTASKAMAAMLYLYVCFYSMGWGPLPWVYVSDIFPTRTRHYGLAVASGSQWLFNFVVAKLTPILEDHLGYKLFFMFGTINILGMAVFSAFLPETKGRTLEEMDILFGAVSAERRREDIAKQERVIEKEVIEGHGLGGGAGVADGASEKDGVEQA